MASRLPIAVAAVLGCLLAPVDAGAQRGQTGSLVGIVRDTSGAALPGVKLTASSPQSIGGPHQTESDAWGRYRFASLLPGTYEVTAALQGFKTLRHSEIEVPPGFTLRLDLRLELAAVAEVVDVRAGASAIDTHTATSPALLDRQLLENLPIDRRSVFLLANLAPGVTRGVAFGGTGGANPFSLDGTHATDPISGQVSAVVSVNWIDELQVVSLGANAEYGEYTGARVNAITRSGSNRFSGLAEYVTTRPNWTGNNRGSLPPDLAQRFRPIEVLERWEISQQVGGPIVQDRLWFFSGLTYYKNAQRPVSFAGVPRTPDEPRTLTRQPRFLVKLTGAPSSRLRLDGYVGYGDSKSTNSNAGPLIRPEALATTTRPERMDNARLTWTVNDRTLVEARYGSYWQHASSGPTPPNTRLGPPSHFDRLTGVTSVNVGTFGDTKTRVRGVNAALTRYVNRFAGQSHELKIGLEHEWAREHLEQGYPGGIAYLDFNGAPDRVRLWDGSTYRGSHRRTSIFAQDTWQVSERLTIEPGIRAGFYDSSVPAPGTFYQNSSLSPRLGAAWDVAADHRTVVRAHYGRYHDPMVTSFYDFLDPLAQAPLITARVLGPGEFQEITRSAAGSPMTIDAEARHPYVAEYLVGIERELWASLTVKAEYVRRSFDDSLGFIDTGTTWRPIGATDPGPDGTLGTSDDGRQMTVYYNDRPEDAFFILTNPADAWRRYNAIQLIATRRHARGWGLQASYTWSRTRGSFDNTTLNAPLGTNGNFVNPNRALFSVGRTTLDRVHDVKVLGTYTLPHWGGVRVSAIYRYQGGTPWARTVDFDPLTQVPGLIRVEPVGAHELPATNNADLRIEKTSHVGAGTVLGLSVEIFNLNNQGIASTVNTRSGRNFGLPTAWIEPRVLRAGVRLTF